VTFKSNSSKKEKSPNRFHKSIELKNVSPSNIRHERSVVHENNKVKNLKDMRKKINTLIEELDKTSPLRAKISSQTKNHILSTIDPIMSKKIFKDTSYEEPLFLRKHDGVLDMELSLLKKKLEEMDKSIKQKDTENRELLDELSAFKAEQFKVLSNKDKELVLLRNENQNLKHKIVILESNSSQYDFIKAYNKDIEEIVKRNAYELETIKGLSTSSNNKVIEELIKSIKEVELENCELNKQRRTWVVDKKLLANSTKELEVLRIEKIKADSLIKRLKENINDLTKKYKTNCIELNKVSAQAKELKEEVLLSEERKKIEGSWDALLDKAIEKADKELIELCESIRIEGQELVRQIARLRENQEILLQALNKVHDNFNVSFHLILIGRKGFV